MKKLLLATIVAGSVALPLASMAATEVAVNLAQELASVCSLSNTAAQNIDLDIVAGATGVPLGTLSELCNASLAGYHPQHKSLNGGKLVGSNSSFEVPYTLKLAGNTVPISSADTYANSDSSARPVVNSATTRAFTLDHAAQVAAPADTYADTITWKIVAGAPAEAG